MPKKIAIDGAEAGAGVPDAFAQAKATATATALQARGWELAEVAAPVVAESAAPEATEDLQVEFV